MANLKEELFKIAKYVRSIMRGGFYVIASLCPLSLEFLNSLGLLISLDNINLFPRLAYHKASLIYDLKLRLRS